MSFLAAWPLIDVVVAIAAFLKTRKEWSGYKKPEQPDGVDERSLGATVIIGQLSAIITGSSIIIAGIAAFVALKETSINPPESYHLFWAIAWAVLSLACAMYCHAILPMRAPTENFVRSERVAIACVLALYFGLAAGVRFLFAVGTILIFAPHSP